MIKRSQKKSRSAAFKNQLLKRRKKQQPRPTGRAGTKPRGPLGPGAEPREARDLDKNEKKARTQLPIRDLSSCLRISARARELMGTAA